MSLTEKYNQIQVHMNTLSTHLTALEIKSMKASAPKARASAQLAKNLLMSLRGEITSHVKSLPIRTRKKAEIISPTHAAVQAEEESGQQKDNSEPEITPSPVVAPKKKVIKKPRVVKSKISTKKTN